MVFLVYDIDEKTSEKGMDLTKAVKRVLPKHKHKFESLFEYDPELEDEELNEGKEEEPGKVPTQPMGFYKVL